MNLNNLSPITLELLLNDILDILGIKSNSTSANIELATENIKISACPHCQSTAFKKNGTINGSQRYLCKDCSKSFGVTNNTFIFSSKLTFEQWNNFIICELEDKSLRASAEYVGVSLPTCFAMRHKLYGAITKSKLSLVLKKNSNRCNVFTTKF